MKYQKLNKEDQAQLCKAVLLMRFRTENPNIKSKKFCTYKNISQFLKVSYGTVQNLCKQAINRRNNRKSKSLVRKLDEEHRIIQTNNIREKHTHDIDN